MSVLKGEGRFPILFGSANFPARTETHRGYLARPGLAGEFPTVVVVPSAWGVTSSVKDLCRRLARWGLAAIAPDLYRGGAPDRSVSRADAEAAFASLADRRLLADLADLSAFVTNPAGFWSNAEAGFGILGIGAGGRPATLAAVRDDRVAALALMYAPLDAHAGDERSHPAGVLEKLAVPLLGLYGRGDEVVPVDEVMAARAKAPHGEWVLYEEAGHDFADDYLESYDGAVAADAVDRLVGFFEKHLPSGPPARP